MIKRNQIKKYAHVQEVPTQKMPMQKVPDYHAAATIGVRHFPAQENLSAPLHNRRNCPTALFATLNGMRSRRESPAAALPPGAHPIPAQLISDGQRIRARSADPDRTATLCNCSDEDGIIDKYFTTPPTRSADDEISRPSKTVLSQTLPADRNRAGRMAVRPG